MCVSLSFRFLFNALFGISVAQDSIVSENNSRKSVYNLKWVEEHKIQNIIKQPYNTEQRSSCLTSSRRIALCNILFPFLFDVVLGILVESLFLASKNICHKNKLIFQMNKT